MDHLDQQDLELEDIVKEFSDPDLEEILKEFGGEESQEEAVVPPAQTTGDTIRLDTIQVAARKQVSQSRTQRFQAVTVEEDAEADTVFAPQPTAQVEPFSEEWEPEYEEPMGVYTPREPIPFRSNDKLRALREKLVKGPEKRFYELSEAGLASLRMSAWTIFLIFLVSAGVTLAFSQGYIGAGKTKFVIFCQLLALLVTALLCHGRLLEGVISLCKGRFTLHSLLGITFLVCCLDSILCLGQQRISCCSIFCLQAAMVQWAACRARRTEMNQMDTLRKASELTAVVKIEDYYEGRSGYVTTEGQLESFMEQYQQPSTPEKSLHIFLSIGVVTALLLAVAVAIVNSFGLAVQVLTAALLVMAPATVFISMRRPETILSERMHAVGTVLCGWKGVKAVDKEAVVPVTHQDLFSGESIAMNGMKFYGSLDPDMVLCYTGSLISHEGGSLTALFDPLMAGRYIRHAPVEEFSSYPGGLSALVDGEPIAVGTLEFMRQMEVAVPKEAQIAGAVYTAVDGVLSGVFAIRYHRPKLAVAGVRNLCGNSKVTPVFVSRDFLLTGRFLREKLKVNTKRMVYLPEEVRAELTEKVPPQEPEVVALTVRKGLPQRSFAVTGAMALRSAQIGGALIHIIGGGLGLAAVLVLSLIGATHLLTPVNLLLYSLVWMVPGWLITEWARYV